MSAAEPKAGKYELVALRWDQQTSKVGEPFDFVRHVQGDIVELTKQEARRLLDAGAVVVPGELERARVAALRAQYEAALASLPPDPDEGGDADAIPEGDPTDKWTVPQLTAYAGQHGIDLGDATKKADIFTKVTA